MITLTATEAHLGDVLLDPDGKTWQRGYDVSSPWATFDGPVPFYGPWIDEYGPQGSLILLVRGGAPVR